MLKKLLLVPIAFLALSCELNFKHAEAQYVSPDQHYDGRYYYKEEVKDGMKFGIWFVYDGTNQTGYNTSVVNLTKDSLEVALLRKQLSN